MKKLSLGLSVLIATIGLFSCGEKKNNMFPGYDNPQKGVYVKYFTKNEGGRVVEQGDILTMSMTYKNSADSVLFSSNDLGQPVQLRADTAHYEGDFIGALMGMRMGDSASILVSADSFFLKTAGAPEVPDYIDSASMLNFIIDIDKVETLEEMQAAAAAAAAEAGAEEMNILKQYLADNNITQEPTPSGLIFISTKEGTGKQAVAGKRVKVNYEGQLLDGKYFDTSIEEVAKAQGIFDARRPYAPFEFDLGKGQVIQGWDEGIALLKEGGKARLIIPSSIAYGANPRPGGPIGPHATLIFDVELLEVME